MPKLSSLNLKKIATVVIISLSFSNLFAIESVFNTKENSVKMAMVNFLTARYSKSPKIKDFKAEVETAVKLESDSNWYGLAVNLSGLYNNRGNYTPFSERQIFFTNGEVFTSELISLKNGQNMENMLAPKVKPEHYTTHNLLYGSDKSKHKIVIFSDPLCPFCQRTIPQLLLYVKQYPKTFAVYYYHLPLEQIHPASVPLTKLMRMAQDQKNPDAVIGSYSAKVSAKESDIATIIKRFNEVSGAKITEAEYKAQENILNALIQHDKEVSSQLGVKGTPTIYFDGEKTNSRDFYKSVKVVD